MHKKNINRLKSKKNCYGICMPLSFEPNRQSMIDDGQIDPQEELCPNCATPMWVSEKKRHLRSINPKAKVWCAVCCIHDIKKHGENIQIKVANLLNYEK